MSFIRTWPVIAILALVGAACGSESSPVAQDPTPDSSSTASPDRKAPEEKEKADETAAPVADPAPDFEVETFVGDTFALREQKGTPVVLNFWESW